MSSSGLEKNNSRWFVCKHSLVAIAMQGGKNVSARLRVCNLSENKYNLSVVCFSLLKHESAAVGDVPKRIAIASYLLRSCLKWDQETVLSPLDVRTSQLLEKCSDMFRSEDPGRILKLLDKRALVSPHLRAYITLETIDIVASGFCDLGYVPGGSWMYRKGIDYARNLGDVNFPSNEYLERFSVRLATIHHISPTAIADPAQIVPLLHESQSTSSLYSSQSKVSLFSGIPSNQLHLNRVRATLDYQEMLSSAGGSSHVGRLCDLMDAPGFCELRVHSDRRKSLETISETIIIFELNATGHLYLSVREGRFEVFQECVNGSDSFQTDILKMYKKFEAVLGKNKELISTSLGASDYTVPLFWEDRRRIDDELGRLMLELEGILFASYPEGREFLIQNSSTMYMCLCDLLLGLPIESLPCFESNDIVRIIPALKMPAVSSARPCKQFYVVNPGGDCPKTQAAMVPFLTGWTGHQGSPTLSDKDLLGRLRESDLFLYSGHGGGEKHWSGSSMQRIRSGDHDSAPRVVLLMGCSSAKPYGDYLAPFCTPFHYLLGGCEIVVGTLWDVLGKELDRVTIGLVESEIISRLSVGEILQCMRRAKQKAKLKYLTAASFVVYMAI